MIFFTYKIFQFLAIKSSGSNRPKILYPDPQLEPITIDNTAYIFENIND